MRAAYAEQTNVSASDRRARLLTLCRYPGDPHTYRVLMDCVDVDLLTMCQV